MPRRMRDVPILPTLVTLGNLFCGFLAIAYVADAIAMPADAPVLKENKLVRAAIFIFIAMVFDALDGRIARWTRQTSPFGAELDSLSDVVTFGVAPAFLAKYFLQGFVFNPAAMHPRLSWILGALFTGCAAMRLARYNTEKGHDEKEGISDFQGLPTPAAAGAIASVVLLYFKLNRPALLGWLMPGLVPVVAMLMVSKIRYPHMVNRLLRDRKPFAFVAQLVALLVLTSIFFQYMLAVVFVGYMLWGLAAEARARFRVGKPRTIQPPLGPVSGEEPRR